MPPGSKINPITIERYYQLAINTPKREKYKGKKFGAVKEPWKLTKEEYALSYHPIQAGKENMRVNIECN